MPATLRDGLRGRHVCLGRSAWRVAWRGVRCGRVMGGGGGEMPGLVWYGEGRIIEQCGWNGLDGEVVSRTALKIRKGVEGMCVQSVYIARRDGPQSHSLG